MAASESAKPLNVIMVIPLSSDGSGFSQSDGEESLAKRPEGQFLLILFALVLILLQNLARRPLCAQSTQIGAAR